MNDDILKDVILSTLAEIEDDIVIKDEVITEKKIELEFENPTDIFQDSPISNIENKVEIETPQNLMLEQSLISKTSSEVDLNFLTSIQEKIATLFDGLKSSEIDNLDQKLDLTLKYLEYLLLSIDEKLK